MKKSELVAKVATKMGGSKKNAELALNAVVASIQESVVEGEKVGLKGFITLGSKEVASRVGRNPKTGASLEIPAHKKPVAKFSNQFKSVIK